MAKQTPTSDDRQASDPRGRTAEAPTQIPPRGWKDVLVRVKKELRDDQVSVLAAGVAFFAMLALFPALIALVSLYGLVASPAEAQAQISSFAGVLPADARELLLTQLSSLASGQDSGLTFGFLASLAAALWTASSGMKAVIEGINLAYDEKETRGFFKVRGLSLVLTVLAIVAAVVALGAIVVIPLVLEGLGLGPFGKALVRFGRWPALALMVIVGLAALYRYGPDRDKPRWRWVSLGAATATVLWLLASIAFSVYVNNFGSYNETYGALGGVIILLLWLYLGGFVVLLGAELDSELEHQTAKDSTEGPSQPLGQRRAQMADTVGEET
jgi:membrane protein